MYEYQLGATELGMDYLYNLGIVAPKSEFRPFSKNVITGNGQKKGLGFPVAIWHWDYVTKDQRDNIRAFVDGLSSTVYFRTRIEDDSYADFVGIMNWVEEEEKYAGRRFDLTLEFTHLVGL